MQICLQILFSAPVNLLEPEVLERNPVEGLCPLMSALSLCAGWMRMCLQVLFFAPANLLEPEASFRRFAGRLIVSPVVRVLVFSKVGTEAVLVPRNGAVKCLSKAHHAGRICCVFSRLVLTSHQAARSDFLTGQMAGMFA